ncbi:MAG: Dabb family protein [Saprospiraceae bacterium]|jgi:hypothetical protein|nr:Dabb family protein [Saprospiraceae bacterium]
MKNILTILDIGILFFSSCKQGIDSQAFEKLKTELDETKTALASANKELMNLQSNDAKQLVHIVLLKLKEDVDKPALINEIKKLENIEEVKNLNIGAFQDLGDARAMSDYEIVLSMEFEAEEAYQTYQAHEIHLKLKENIGKYLAGPPVTYDYWEQ